MDPLHNRTFGGILRGDSRFVRPTRTAPFIIHPGGGSKRGTSASFSVVVLTEQTDAIEIWLHDLLQLHSKVINNAIEDDDNVSFSSNAWKNHVASWREFWDRSFMVISSDVDQKTSDIAHNVSALYTYQRYLSACSGKGASPIKFNGLAFTVAPVAGNPLGPDFRVWGSGFWFQNTRLPYYPMLMAGDFDLLIPMYRFYASFLHLAMLRTQVYFNHSGAFFPETLTMFGTYENNYWGYGCSQKADHLPDNTYMRYHYEGSIELVFMMLDHWAFKQDTDMLKQYLIPLANAVTQFYGEHWPKRDEQDKILFYPSQVRYVCYILAEI